MKLSIENGRILCTLENKNVEFLRDCAGLFDGFYKGKLKMYWNEPGEGWKPKSAMKLNAERLGWIISSAGEHGIEVDEGVLAFNAGLQSAAEEIKERERAQERAEEELKKKAEHWALKCKAGCKGCKNLGYDADVPICKQTGETLVEKNVPEYVGRVLYLFNPVPFPTENCPFNINNRKGAKR